VDKQTFSCPPAQRQRKQRQDGCQTMGALGMSSERLGKALCKGVLCALLILTAKAADSQLQVNGLSTHGQVGRRTKGSCYEDVEKFDGRSDTEPWDW
jgi:hypothetical protein